jgi:N-acetylglucosamine-6-phosphate deacetylase
LKGTILTSTGWMRGELRFDERINAIDAKPIATPEGDDDIILPGFIDLHLHGGGGHDIMQGNGAADVISRMHASHGTTSLLATTMTAPFSDLERAFTDVAPSMKKRVTGGARVLGIHLEGPYINSGRLGAQPNFARAGAMTEIRILHDIAPIRLVTIAPEIVGHMEVISGLMAMGIKVQIGHTLGTYEDGVAALAQGASGFTHLFNAMTALHHREPGIVGAALAHADYSEIIPDLLHVHPGAIKAAARSIPHLYCVTDATAAAGMPDGQYQLGRHTVTKCLGGVRLPDGTLAGSTLTMDQALRNLITVGLDLADASKRLSTYPAAFLGLKDRGTLGVGNYADVVVLNRKLKLKAIYVEGESIAPADAG